MPSFEFERKISLGNLMSAMLIIASVIGAWVTLDNRTAANAEDIVTVADRIAAEATARASDISEVNGRLSNLEGKFEALVDSINADRLGNTRLMTQLQSDVTYVKSTMDEIRRNLPATQQ